MALKKKKINMSTKTAKYFKAHNLKGLTKTEAAKKAGISNIKNITNIERTETYRALEHKYAKHLEDKLGLAQVADEHIKNILQDQDKGAKNNAIKMYVDRVDPDVKQREEEDKLIVILR